ncbi:MAG TPA: Na+/H+ antiporter NhaA [Steroidobacteraceae bacterium]|nr:Na+/H+ antiporter NhaA [Steroidobacteraceae bacterium]
MNWHSTLAPRAVARLFVKPLERFLRVEAAGGVLLLLAAATALLLANSPWASWYDALWSTPLTLRVGSLVSTEPVRFWINDGLMTFFFLVVGLEVKREMHDGALADRRAAVLPVAAALGGVLVPAAFYLLLNSAAELRQGWAIPTATDIAFAVGVLSLLGSRVPSALRALLLTLAVVDDLVAVMVIAGFYAADIAPIGLLIAAAGVLVALALRRLTCRNALVYVVPGAMIWIGLKYAGIHPTVAGVILGLLTPSVICSGADHAPRNRPARTRRELPAIGSTQQRSQRAARALTAHLRRAHLAQRDALSPAARIEAVLHPWVAYGLMPLFALANAGVALPGAGLRAIYAPTLAAGILLALALGKPLGILLTTWLCTRARLTTLPAGIDWRHMLVLGCLGGIGFTMSIFIGNLAFTAPSLLATAKLSVLIGSALSASAGLLLGWSLLRAGARGRTAPP